MSNRVIKDLIWTSPRLAACSMESQLHFPRLILLSDDWGCFNCDPAVIKGAAYPKMHIGIKKIDKFLNEYNSKGLLFIWTEGLHSWGFWVKSVQHFGYTEYSNHGERIKHRRKTPEPPKKELNAFLESHNYKDIQELLAKREGKEGQAERELLRARQYAKHRRAVKKGADGSHTAEQWEEMKKAFNYSCALCGKAEPEIKLTQDHIIPLSKGGDDFITNIQPLCEACNKRKGTSWNIVEQVGTKFSNLNLNPKPNPNPNICAPELDSLFEKWWKRYPRNDDKGKGKEKWLALVNTGINPQTLEDALTGYINCLNSKNTDIEYVKHAKTFLYAGNPSKNIPSTWEPYLKYADLKYKAKAEL